MKLYRVLCLVCLFAQLVVVPVGAVRAPQAAIYYVSASDGSDGYNGLSESTPFETVGKVNTLNLQPGDRVLFKCGDTWRAEQLVIDDSGTASEPITLGSYPAGCADRPILSGAQPIAGWIGYGANVYVADLSAGANAGKFAYGVNQLFRGAERLPMGRWPNLDAGDGGYSTIDGQPSGDRITDNELPAGDWTGAVAHIRGMRWYILNREVAGDSGSTLTLGADAGCWGSCTGWGYFLNNHLATLDREGEWYYDAATHCVYLYTAGSVPADEQIEGSVVLKDDDRSWGGVMLGVDLNDPGVSYVIVENLDVRRWFRHGIATPTNHAHYENHHVTLQNNAILDVDSIGINLMSWVWNAEDGRPDGWRGGYNIVVDGNTIDTANRMGINTYGRNSTFSDNVIRDVGLIENLGAAGMGCGFTQGEGGCTEDGDGLRIKIDRPNDSGNYNTVTGNRLERIAYGGIQIFGHHNTFERNAIHDACYAKGDCGGISTYSSNFSQTPVYDLVFRENVIVNTIGNTDGCLSTYDPLFGFGFYLSSSKNVALIDNTVISSTVHGILFQYSTGSVTGNTLYGNGRARYYDGAQVYVGESPSHVSEHTGNVLYGLQQHVRTLWIDDPSRLSSSDNNYFFNPYRASHIYAGGDRTLASWQSYSGKDGSSTEHWFTLGAGDAPLSRIFYNDTTSPLTVDLGTRKYLDLDQNEVLGSVVLQPFESVVLID
ncbi:MAG: right-handed parallel beta-helix repeat-containing protein, partial [Anaerolineae bacterium]|nr:right-handed parallel beta-helix repeat-containing protein [Anaerolineae bacterium]